jgi:hypothetical protein
MVKKNPIKQHSQFVVMYLENLLNPLLWIDNANQLHEACKILELKLREYWSVISSNNIKERYDNTEVTTIEPPPNIFSPYFILISYSLEDYFKAIIVRDRKDEVSAQFFQHGMLPPLLKEHNLKLLSKKLILNYLFRKKIF